MTQVTLDPREGGRASPLAGGLSGQMIGRAVGDAFVKLNPVKLINNPVIFTTWIVALLSTTSGKASRAPVLTISPKRLVAAILAVASAMKGLFRLGFDRDNRPIPLWFQPARFIALAGSRPVAR